MGALDRRLADAPDSIDRSAPSEHSAAETAAMCPSSTGTPLDFARARKGLDALRGVFAVSTKDSLAEHLAMVDRRIQNDEPELLFEGSSFLERYEIEHLLGEGGFASVFLARDQWLERHVAIKVFNADIATLASSQSQFLLEARTMAELRHPAIVPIYDAGIEGALWYLVMEYVEGPSLAVHAQSAAGAFLSYRSIARVVAELADAVQYAHARGRLHCDIKPSNVLLEPVRASSAGDFPYTAKLSDFGLARRLDESPTTTTGLTIAGTPRYMAPEQVHAEYGDLTVQTDVYALGCVLYEFLTGQAPFANLSTDAWSDVVGTAPPPHVTQLRFGVPPDLAAICHRCLAPLPARRYDTAHHLKLDLIRFLAGEPVAARPLGVAGIIGRWIYRHPLVALLSSALVVTTVAGVLATSYLYHHERVQRELAESKRQQARQAVDDMYGFVTEELLSPQPGMDSVAQQAAEKALAFYEQETRERPDDEQGMYGLQVALHRRANILGLLGRGMESIKCRRRCLRVIDQLLKASPGNYDYRFAHFHNHLLLAIEALELNLREDALRSAEVADQEIGRLLSDYPDKFDVVEAATTAALRLGHVKARFGQLSEQDFAHAEDLARQLESRFATNPRTPLTVAHVAVWVSNEAFRSRSAAERLELIDHAISLLENAPSDGQLGLGGRELLCESYNVRSCCMLELRRDGEAAQSIEYAIALRRKLADDFPSRPCYREHLGYLQLNQATFLWILGKHATAMELASNARATLLQVQDLVPQGSLSADERRLLRSDDLRTFLDERAKLYPPCPSAIKAIRERKEIGGRRYRGTTRSTNSARSVT